MTLAVDISQQTGEKEKFDPRTHVTGYARMDDFAHHTGHMKVKLENGFYEWDYFILRTDYTSYAVVYSCDYIYHDYNDDLPGEKVEGAWVLTRIPTPALDPIVDQAKIEFKKVGLDWDSEMEFTL